MADDDCLLYLGCEVRTCRVAAARYIHITVKKSEEQKIGGNNPPILYNVSFIPLLLSLFTPQIFFVYLSVYPPPSYEPSPSPLSLPSHFFHSTPHPRFSLPPSFLFLFQYSWSDKYKVDNFFLFCFYLYSPKMKLINITFLIKPFILIAI